MVTSNQGLIISITALGSVEKIMFYIVLELMLMI